MVISELRRIAIGQCNEDGIRDKLHLTKVNDENEKFQRHQVFFRVM